MRGERRAIKSSRVLRDGGLSQYAVAPSLQPHLKAQACERRSMPAELWQHARGDFRLLANIPCRSRAQSLLWQAKLDRSAGNARVRREFATQSDAPRLIHIPGNNIC